jgi:flavin-dependent dehydrogenase
MDDIIVVGGRCAGAPTAMLLARAGLRVRVIERSSRLGDTLSGHMVKSAGTARLHAWGLLDDVLGTGCPPVLTSKPRSGFDAARRDPMEHYLGVLESQPAAMEVLAGAAPVEPLRGTGDLPTYIRESAGPGWALAGDAGHHKDPLTARGISDAFRDAELITAAVTGGWDGDLDEALAAYPAQRDACARPLSAALDAATSGLGSLPLATLTEAIATAYKVEEALDPPRAAAHHAADHAVRNGATSRSRRSC